MSDLIKREDAIRAIDLWFECNSMPKVGRGILFEVPSADRQSGVAVHQIDIAPNNAIYIDRKRVIGSKPYGLFETKTISISDKELVRIAERCDELLKGADDEDN